MAFKGLEWAQTALANLRRALVPTTGYGQAVLGITVLGILLTVGGYIGWAKWGGQISTNPKYLLSAESLEITPPPDWIHSDIKKEVMRDASLKNVSILDPELTTRVVRAFELHAWVAEAVWAGKRPGNPNPRVIVELRYREPVIMVRTHDERWEGDCFWPVDTEGVLLPPDEFSAVQTQNFLRVHASNSLPAGPVGTPYGDPGVAGASKIAKTMQKIWRAAGLEWIVVQGEPVTATAPSFVLLPAGSSPALIARQTGSSRWASDRENARRTLEIRWGHAPGQESRGEATAQVKAARLWRFVQENGRLDLLPQTTIIDLRPESAMSVTTGTTSVR